AHRAVPAAESPGGDGWWSRHAAAIRPSERVAGAATPRSHPVAPGPPTVEGQRPCACTGSTSMSEIHTRTAATGGFAGPHAAAIAMPDPDPGTGRHADVATWITKDAGNRRLPYRRERL